MNPSGGVFGLIIALLLLFGTGIAAGETRWENNIAVSEHNIVWGYTEIFTGTDSMVYRIRIDSDLGNNDSFVNAWELLNADKDIRKKFRESLDKEPDLKINNETTGIEVTDIDSSLSQDILGKTHSVDMIRNMYNVTYRLKENISDSSTIWFLGGSGSPVTITFPRDIDIINISGMDNESLNVDKSQITGNFSRKSVERGEITVSISRNKSYNMNYSMINVIETAVPQQNASINQSSAEVSGKIRDWSIIGIGIILIIIIYVFKIKNKQR